MISRKRFNKERLLSSTLLEMLLILLFLLLAISSIHQRLIQDQQAALESGDKASFAGKAVQLNDAQLAIDLPARMPLYMAASGPRMLHLAGELCDGVLFLCGTHPACIAFALEQIRAGAERGGRTIEDLDVGWTIYGSLRDDVDLAREDAVEEPHEVRDIFQVNAHDR